MSNPFDQFDTLDATNANSANPFDQFDSVNAKTTTDRPNATLLDTAQQGYSSMKAAEMLDLNRQYRTAIPELEKSAAEAGPLTKWAYDMQLDRNQRGLQETQDYLNQYSEAQKVAPVNPTLDKIQKSKTFSEVWDAVKENPVDAITHGVASSAVPSALMLGNAYLGGRVGGLPGASIAGGATSADVEYKSGVVEGLNQAGVNLSDKQSLDKALDNTSLMDQIDVQAGQKAAVVGALDAASLGVAGKLFPNSALKAAGANAVVQPALGAGGEALGSVYSGQEVKPGAVALEALGELPSSVAEVALARNARKESKPNQENPEATQNIYADQSPTPQQRGLDMNAVVDRMIGAESAGKADAKNPLSSAEGLGQFIDSTWLKMVKKHRSDIANGKSDQEILDLKTNGALSREMTTRYAEDNMQELQSSGFEATGRNVYLAHHFGVGGARSLLRADPNVPVASVVSAQVIQQNPYMRGKTVGQVLDFIGNKMGEQAGTVSNETVQPNASIIDSPAQSATETNPPESTTPDSTTSPSLTDAINPALQAGTEAMQAAQAPMDILTSPSSSENLNDRVNLLTGKASRIRSEDGQWHEANYQVVEASDLQSTMDKATNQYRDRTRQGLADQVQGIAKDLQYDLVAQSPVMEIGSPVLAQDGSVIAGNGRLAGIQQAYQQGKASDYKARLLEDAPNLGIDAAQVQAMQQPVLIRSFKGEIDAQRLATLSNEGGSARMSPLEQAKVDAERIGSLSGFTPDESGNITPASSQQLIKRLVMNTPQNQHNALMDSKGQVSQEGMRRIQNAVLYMSYGDSPALSRLVETTDTDGRNILRALNGAAPALAEMRDNIRQGISHQADIVPELIGAVEVFARLKAKGENIQSWLNQLDAFGDIPNEIKSILLFLDQNSRRPAVIRAMLIDYANLLKGYGAPSQNDLFNAEPPTKQEVLNRAIQASEEQPAADLLSGAGRGGQAGGNRFDQQPQAESATSAGIDAGNQGQGGITSSGADAKASSDIQYSVSGVNDADLSYAAEVLNEFAKYDDLFRYPVSGKYTLSEIMAEVSPNVRYLGEDTRPDESAVSTAEHRYMFQTEKNRNFYVYTRNEGRDGTVWIDVSRLAEGDGGSGIYAAIANYAYNNKMEFIGDPDGLSEAATQRRTQHMLSSFLRYGSIDHFSPSKEQMSGIPEKGIPALAWQGSDVDRLKSLIDVSLATLHNRFPAIKGARYDFTRQQFVDSRGLPFTDADFERIASAGGISQARAGDKTLRRGILLQSLVSGQNRESGILDRVLLRSRKLLSGLSGIFSQQDTTGRTRSGLSVSEVQAELAAKLGDARVKRLQLLGKLVFADNPPVDGVQGSYQNGVVTLYSDNIQQGDAWSVFLHEAGEHANLEQMLGTEKYVLVVSSFDKLVKSGNADAIRAAERVPANTPDQHVAAERLAYLIEDFTNNTLKTGGAKNLARRVIAALRAWAFAKLPAWARPQELSVADIQALAARAARGWAEANSYDSITLENGKATQAVEKQAVVNGSEVSNADTLFSIKSIAKSITTPNQQRNADGLLQMGRVIINEVIASPHQAIRDIGTPSARAIADLIRRPMENENSTTQGALDDMNAATYARQGEFSQKLSAILDPLITKRTKLLVSFTIPKADREALVRGLHTGIVPKRLAPAAKQLRAWLDELRDYQEAAGLDFGYVKNYFPRVYDLKKVLNNQQGFTDMLQRHGYAPDVAATILARIVNGDTLPEMQMNTTNRVILAANGQQGTFMPREGGVAGSAGKSGHQQSRVLDIPYDELAPYLNNDLETILTRYMGNAIKRAEYARRFGANEEELNKLVASMVDEIDLGQRDKVGALNASQAVGLVYDVADMMQGAFAQPITRVGGTLTRTVLNLQVMIKLPLAVLSAMPEFLTPGLLSQSPSAHIAALVQGVGAGAWEGMRAMDKVITGKHHFNQSEAYAQAEEIGVIAHAAIQDALESLHFQGDSSTDLLSVGTRKFMQLTLQEQTMRLQKTIAVRTFMHAVKQWARSTQKANSEQLLKDFGIDPQEANRWATAGFPDNDPIQFALNRGAIRFANSAVTTPDASVRSRGLQRKYAGLPLLWQFQSFSNAFGNTMLRRILVQQVRAKNARQLVIITGMIMMMAAAFAAQELRDWWKYGDNKPYKDDTKDDPLRRIFNSFDRAGFTGMFSRVFELISPYKFGYGQQGAARIAGLAGPTATDVGKVIDAFAVDQGNDKKQADMQAKFITNMIPIVSGLPYQTKQDYFVDPLSESLR